VTDVLTTPSGTLLTIIPALDGRFRMAIVGYLLPPAPQSVTASGERGSGLFVDRAQHRVLVEGRDIKLLFQEFELLELLATNPGRVFGRDEILSQAWNSPPQATTRTVDVHVHRVRHKLGPQYARCLVTVRKVGYMFRQPGQR
jgi:DNA-binding response OmpR family regulator